jgi:hypothetical protein
MNCPGEDAGKAMQRIKHLVLLVCSMLMVSACATRTGYLSPTVEKHWSKPTRVVVLSEAMVWLRANNTQSVELLVRESRWLAEAVAGEIKRSVEAKAIEVSETMSFVAAHDVGVSYFTVETADSSQIKVMNPPILLDQAITFGSEEQKAVSSIFANLDRYENSTHGFVKEAALQTAKPLTPEEINFDPEDFRSLFGESCPPAVMLAQSHAMGYRDGEKAKEWAKAIAIATVTAAATLGMFSYTQKNTFPCHVKAALVDTHTGEILWCNHSLRQDGYELDKKQEQPRSLAWDLIKNCKLLDSTL